MVFSYGYCWWQNQQWHQHVPPLLAILMAMVVCQCNTKCIAHCSMSRATLDATGRRHRATTCSVLPQWPPGQQANKQQSTNTPTKLAILMAMTMHRYLTGRIAPTEYTDVLRLPRSITKGDDVTQGHLDESKMLELRDDLINNWNICYSNPDYRPCKTFSSGIVDRMSNRKIYKKHFTQVPLLMTLVDTFETMFPYLSVDLVWLLRKSKEGDGFQGWHKDFLLGKWITKTIVTNVGSKERDNEETTRSFDNDVSFEVDDWKEIAEYALNGFNLEDKLPNVGSSLRWLSASTMT